MHLVDHDTKLLQLISDVGARCLLLRCLQWAYAPETLSALTLAVIVKIQYELMLHAQRLQGSIVRWFPSQQDGGIRLS